MERSFGYHREFILSTPEIRERLSRLDQEISILRQARAVVIEDDDTGRNQRADITRRHVDALIEKRLTEYERLAEELHTITDGEPGVQL